MLLTRDTAKNDTKMSEVKYKIYTRQTFIKIKLELTILKLDKEYFDAKKC